MASSLSGGNNVIDRFLEEYDDMEAGLKELAGEVEEQCRGKLQEAGIEAIVTSRQKSKDSLRKKLYTVHPQWSFRRKQRL